METTIFIGIIVAVVGIGLFLLAAPAQKKKMRENQEAKNPPIINFMLVIIFIIIGVALFDASPILPGSMFAGMIPSTQATVTRMIYTRDAGGNYYRVNYSYLVDGESYKGQSTYQLTDEIPEVGETFQVYYFNIYPAYTSRSATHFLMIAVFVLIVITVAIAMVLNLVFGFRSGPMLAER